MKYKRAQYPLSIIIHIYYVFMTAQYILSSLTPVIFIYKDYKPEECEGSLTCSVTTKQAHQIKTEFQNIDEIIIYKN